MPTVTVALRTPFDCHGHQFSSDASIGIGAFLLTAPDVAYRVPAVIACMVAILSSLLVSYARARADIPS